ncbi:regulator of nonsense transcripts 2-like [Clavelina lepadiformis]|uniref:regulator of nonsense transcripts 2-like n=1 Tax=Clavelina lepadiformis TaxID=159417 RepID=UPI004041570D
MVPTEKDAAPSDPQEEVPPVTDDDEKDKALHIKVEAEERFEKKLSLRATNQNATSNYPDDSFFRRLDSNLKKNTAFVKKLGKLNEQQRTQLSNEFKLLNLSRYIQEVVATLAETKMKMNDIPCAVHLSSLMHQRYQDFTPCLFKALKRIFQTRADDKASLANSMSKVRTDLRFVAELTVAGIFTDKEGLTLIHNQLCAISSTDRDKHDLLPVIISLCKYNGEDLAGLLSRKSRTLIEKYDLDLPRSQIFAADKQKIFYNVLLEYWNSVKDHLVSMHKDMKALEQRNRHILQSKGELHEDKSKEFSDKQEAYQKLLFNANSLADLLDVDAPDLPESDPTVREEESSINIFDPSFPSVEAFGEQSIWEDEDQCSFYSNLLDLQAIIPAILFKASGGKSSKKQSDGKPQKKDHSNEAKPSAGKQSGKGELSYDEIEISNLEELEEVDRLIVEEGGLVGNSPSGYFEKIEASGDTEKDLSPDEDADEEEVSIGASIKVLMDNFITSLKDCINRDLVDKAAQDFCMTLNTRVNRKKLARALFNVHRSRLDLLPFYSRLAATLHLCVPDVSDHLILMLFRDFRFHIRKKDQIHIESKVKTVRFIGEMTKFGLVPVSDTLHCLKVLILEFSPHTIEMACALLETCGRYLLRSAPSHLRARVLLDQLVRKRTAKALDQRYCTMIDNARYTCDPPKVETVTYKPRPPLHEYLRKLLFRDLSKNTVEKVLRQMRKFPWNALDVYAYMVKCLSQSWNVKYNNVHCLASLVAGLVAYRDDIGYNVVDDVLEEIRVGMEINHPRYNQRRVSSVKFLGELYNYRMLESVVIFNVLYSFITFGVTYNSDQSAPLDPPENLFRIRLVCVLLETCGQYFDRGSSKKKLDYFISYFQRYIWHKKSLPYWSESDKNLSVDPAEETMTSVSRFPVEVDYLVQDTIEALRPKIHLATSLQTAIDAVSDVEKEVFVKLSKLVSQEQIHGLGSWPNLIDHRGLTSIPEGHEMDGTDGEDDYDESTTDYNSQTEDSDTEREWEPSTNDENSVADTQGQVENLVEDSSLSGVSKMRHVTSAEDDDFKKAFDSIMVESMQMRKQSVVQQDMTVPVNVHRTLLQEQSASKDQTIRFALLTKKGNKPTLKPLRIPVSEELATGLRDRTEAEEKRKRELKQITLSINERQVEEEQHQMEMSNSRIPPANLNRERRPKYQPPKGAPNADLIFNTGGRRR